MIVKQFFDPVSSTYTYILAYKRRSEALIIDPVQENVDEYLEFLGDNELRLTKAIDTHIHADHITGLGKLRDLTKCMTIMGEQAETSLVSRRVTDGDKIEIKGITLDVLYTPGHTNDSYSFYTKGMVFTGDTVFIRGNGRADFQAGDPSELYDSITRIFSYPDDTIVFPGHDYKGENMSTIGREKIENPRYFNKTREEFIAIMDGLNLPNPKMMDIAVPANQAFGEDFGASFSADKVLSTEQVTEKLSTATFIDLRCSDEIEKTGTIKGSLNVKYEDFEAALKNENSELNSAIKDGHEIILFCAYGERSGLALQICHDQHLENVSHFHGGMNAWLKAGLETTKS